VSVQRVVKAAVGWLQAVATRGAKLEDVASPDIVVDRYHWDDKRLVETRTGTEQVREWLEMTRPVIGWMLAGDPVALPGEGPLRVQVRYRVSHADWENFGTWVITLGDDDRITHVQHLPGPLGSTAEADRVVTPEPEKP